MSIQIKSGVKCPTCGAAMHVGAEDRSVRCKYCQTVVEISRFTQEEKRLVKAIEEMQEAVSQAERHMEEALGEFARTGSAAAGTAQHQAEAHYRAIIEALEKKQAAYENAQARKLGGYFRLGEEAQRARRYEEAIGHYQKILAVCEEEADIHWRVLMCRYGVEYVRDQLTGTYLPTLTKMQVGDIVRDADYQAACRLAQDEDARAYYRREGERLAEILAKYQHISGTAEPYDVFISVKQGDDAGQPTEDSAVGIELYELLTAQGLRVFNSRMSLKAGEEYEPCIMHALMTAKLLVVAASSEEYLNSRWLRNEWRRFAWLKQNEGVASERRLIVYSCAQKLLKIPAAIGAVQIIDAKNVDAPTQMLLNAAQEICSGKTYPDTAGAPTAKKKNKAFHAAVHSDTADAGAHSDTFVQENAENVWLGEAAPESELELIEDKKGGYILKKYKGKREYVAIPEEIRGRKIAVIGRGAFSPILPFIRNHLRTVHIPEGVTKIRNGAFRNCRDLREVYMPESLTQIGTEAFHGCRALKLMHFGQERAAEEGVVKFPTYMRIVGMHALINTGIRECNIYKGTAFGSQGRKIIRFFYPEGRVKKPAKKLRMKVKPIHTALMIASILAAVICAVVALELEDVVGAVIIAAVAALVMFFMI